MRKPLVINAIIDSFWNDDHQEWEGTAELQVGHFCNCPDCRKTGLKINGVVSTGRNRKEAWALACNNVQIALSAIQGVPFAIITNGTQEVQFSADIIEDDDPCGEEGFDDEYGEYVEEDLVYTR